MSTTNTLTNTDLRSLASQLLTRVQVDAPKARKLIRDIVNHAFDVEFAIARDPNGRNVALIERDGELYSRFERIVS